MARTALMAFAATALFATSSLAATLQPQPRGNHPSETSGSARTVTNFIALGDSYTDSCNVWNGGYFNPGMMPPSNGTTFPQCPPPPTGRADQGRSWPEWIRIDQGQSVSNTSAPGGDATAEGQWDIVNLAQSGATCDNAIFPRAPIPDIGQQTTLYQNNYNTSSVDEYIKSDPNTTTLAMFIGTNDVTLALNGTGVVSQETMCIEQRLTKLHTIGFRHFLLIQNINLQDCPLLNTTQFRNGAKQMVNENNSEQAKLVTKLTKYWGDDGTVIDIFPAYDLFKSFYDHPDEYGFTDVNDPCNTCSNPHQYLWANTLHPSSRAFHIFARKIVRFVSHGARGSSLIKGSEGL